MIDPMLCQPASVVPTGPEWVAECKYDGWRVVATCKLGEVTLRTRGGNRIVSVPYLERALAAVMPEDTVLDGEVIDPTRLLGARNHVASVCRRESEHVPSDRDPALAIVVFDVMRLLGAETTGLTLRDRRVLLERIVPIDGPVRRTEWLEPSKETLERLLEEGHEGVVFKRLDSRYEPGRRSRRWQKVKPAVDLEMEVVVDALPHDGHGKNLGLVGAVGFVLPSGRRGRCGGMTDAERLEMTHRPELWLGKTITVKHWGVTEKGAVMHPVFGFRRDDL